MPMYIKQNRMPKMALIIHAARSPMLFLWMPKLRSAQMADMKPRPAPHFQYWVTGQRVFPDGTERTGRPMQARRAQLVKTWRDKLTRSGTVVPLNFELLGL